MVDNPSGGGDGGGVADAVDGGAAAGAEAHGAVLQLPCAVGIALPIDGDGSGMCRGGVDVGGGVAEGYILYCDVVNPVLNAVGVLVVTDGYGAAGAGVVLKGVGVVGVGIVLALEALQGYESGVAFHYAHGDVGAVVPETEAYTVERGFHFGQDDAAVHIHFHAVVAAVGVDRAVRLCRVRDSWCCREHHHC